MTNCMLKCLRNANEIKMCYLLFTKSPADRRLLSFQAFSRLFYFGCPLLTTQHSCAFLVLLSHLSQVLIALSSNTGKYRSVHRIKEVNIIVYTSQLNLGSERSPYLGHTVQAERPKAARPNLT